MQGCTAARNIYCVHPLNADGILPETDTAMTKMLLLFCVCAMTLLMTSEAFPASHGYIHMDEPCPVDEMCPLRPHATCKLDCLHVDASGKGHDCIYHFYENGKQVFCWM